MKNLLFRLKASIASFLKAQKRKAVRFIGWLFTTEYHQIEHVVPRVAALGLNKGEEDYLAAPKGAYGNVTVRGTMNCTFDYVVYDGLYETDNLPSSALVTVRMSPKLSSKTIQWEASVGGADVPMKDEYKVPGKKLLKDITRYFPLVPRSGEIRRFD